MMACRSDGLDRQIIWIGLMPGDGNGVVCLWVGDVKCLLP